MSEKKVPFETLLGKTLMSLSIERVGADRLHFTTSDNVDYIQYHDQECCEDVYLDDVCGNLNDLVGHPILRAEEVSNQGSAGNGNTCTWTFYKLATIDGDVTIRWYGESNGHYSETVGLYEQNVKFHIKVEIAELWGPPNYGKVESELLVPHDVEKYFKTLGFAGLYLLMYKSIIEGVNMLQDLKQRMSYVYSCGGQVSEIENSAIQALEKLIDMGRAAKHDSRWVIKEVLYMDANNTGDSNNEF